MTTILTKAIDYIKPNIEGEFQYRIKGHSINSKCYLRFYQGENKQIIILTELKDNPGASITNSAEYFHDWLKDYFQKNHNIELKEDAILIEHYETNHYGEPEDERFALFDRKGKFQHLTIDRLKLIFQEQFSREETIALLQSWSSSSEDEYDPDELDICYSLRGSEFVEPIIDTWTIYKGIEEFGDKYVAVHKLGGFADVHRKSQLIIKDNIDEIRDIMEGQGRIRREPVHNSEPQIIEFWV